MRAECHSSRTWNYLNASNADLYIGRTTIEPPSDEPRERQKFERKLLKFWAQSFLLGVPKIVVGFRTQNGSLVRIQDFETQKLPGLVSRGQGSWDGQYRYGHE